MIFIKSRQRREKRKRLIKTLSVVLAAVLFSVVVSYLFLSGFNYLETWLGWKKNIIAGLITGLMACWCLLGVIIRYVAQNKYHKFYDKLSLGVYGFLFVGLIVAFFLNFGAGIGISFLCLSLVESGLVWWHQADKGTRKRLKRRLPWIFYR